MTLDISPLLSRGDSLGDFGRAVASACAQRSLPVGLRELLFCLRDMPYLRSSDSASVENVLSEWRGTCSGKHVVVHALLQALDLEPRLFMRAYPVDAATGLPARLLTTYQGHGIWDVHNFVRCKLGAHLTLIDVTWPKALLPSGFCVTTRWTEGDDFVVAAPAGEDIAISADAAGLALKRSLLAQHNGPVATPLRERLIEELAVEAARVSQPVTMTATIASTLDDLSKDPS